MQILKQSTAVDVLIGPFVDSTDGYTSEEGLSPAVELSKNGQALAAKNDATTPTHDDFGMYNCELDATDTNTVGTLVLAVEGSATHLPVRHEFQVVEEDIYDAMFAASAAAFDSNARVDVAAIAGTAQTANDNGADINAILVDTNSLNDTKIPDTISLAAINAQVDTALTDIHLDHLLAADYDPASKPGTATALLNELVENDAGVSRFTANALEEAPTGGSAPTAVEIRTEIDSNSTQLAAIVADTGELQTDWADGGRLDVILDARASQTSVDTVDTVVDGIQTDLDNGTDGLGAIKTAVDAIPTDSFSPAKNVALNNVVFYMVDADDHITPETGLSSITAEISQDGAAFGACTNSVVEISDGYYKINLTQSEMNADQITLRFAHANADEVGYSFTTTE